jgi:hypothetical protein
MGEEIEECIDDKTKPIPQNLIWMKIKENFINNPESIQDVQEYLKDNFGIEMKGYTINNYDKPYSRWKSELDNQVKDLSNIVYIKCYIDKKKQSKPFICGMTKTGKCGTTDFDFSDKRADGDCNYNGRCFLEEENLRHDKEKIYLFGTGSPKAARVLESHLQKKFNLFGS